MKLLEDIIDLASSETGSVATLLRKCLVLSHALKSDRLKAWVENELNGYPIDSVEIPAYRTTTAGAKGFLLGRGGGYINDQPIPPALLQEHHRSFAESALLFQPIAAYEAVDNDSKFVIEWPANLIALYQRKILLGYNLNRAWQEVPGSVVVGLIDTVRTRILRFVLELRDDLGLVGDNLHALPKEKIDHQVNMYIYGGNNVIASENFTQIDNIEIEKGDWATLAAALNKLGVQSSAISELRSALDQDSIEQGPLAPTGLGKRVASWLKELGKKSGELAIKIGVDVAQKEASKWILEYLGRHGH